MVNAKETGIMMDICLKMGELWEKKCFFKKKTSTSVFLFWNRSFFGHISVWYDPFWFYPMMTGAENWWSHLVTSPKMSQRSIIGFLSDFYFHMSGDFHMTYESYEFYSDLWQRKSCEFYFLKWHFHLVNSFNSDWWGMTPIWCIGVQWHRGSCEVGASWIGMAIGVEVDVENC